jgi:hypothetical protein
MCAEFQIRVRADELKKAYRIASPGTFEPQPAYYPRQKILVIGLMADGVSRGLNLLRWALIPSDSADAESDRRASDARCAQGVCCYVRGVCQPFSKGCPRAGHQSEPLLSCPQFRELLTGVAEGG